jgi:hypothetical protein
MRLLSHARYNAIAYLALFVALGGTSYAAVGLAPGSVGTAQLRNGAVTERKIATGSVSPQKLDPKVIGGSVRHWAEVSADGTIESSSSKAQVIGNPQQGGYVVSWSDTFSDRCAAIATPVAPALLLGASAGYANARVAGERPTRVWVDMYDPQGRASPSGFSVAVIC